MSFVIAEETPPISLRERMRPCPTRPRPKPAKAISRCVFPASMRRVFTFRCTQTTITEVLGLDQAASVFQRSRHRSRGRYCQTRIALGLTAGPLGENASEPNSNWADSLEIVPYENYVSWHPERMKLSFGYQFFRGVSLTGRIRPITSIPATIPSARVPTRSRYSLRTSSRIRPTPFP